MLRKMIRRSGMLALVLALALAGAAPAAAMEGGRNLGGWDSVWDWFAELFDLGWGSGGNSGGLTPVFEMEGAGFDPNGTPHPNVIPGGTVNINEGAGFDPNGVH
jgi:hypothetical protein